MKISFGVLEQGDLLDDAPVEEQGDVHRERVGHPLQHRARGGALARLPQVGEVALHALLQRGRHPPRAHEVVDLLHALDEGRLGHVEVGDEAGHVTDDVAVHGHADDLHADGVDDLEVLLVVGVVIAVADGGDGRHAPVQGPDVLVHRASRLLARPDQAPPEGHEVDALHEQEPEGHQAHRARVEGGALLEVAEVLDGLRQLEQSQEPEDRRR